MRLCNVMLDFLVERCTERSSIRGCQCTSVTAGPETGLASPSPPVPWSWSWSFSAKPKPRTTACLLNAVYPRQRLVATGTLKTCLKSSKQHECQGFSKQPWLKRQPPFAIARRPQYWYTTSCRILATAAGPRRKWRAYEAEDIRMWICCCKAFSRTVCIALLDTGQER